MPEIEKEFVQPPSAAEHLYFVWKVGTPDIREHVVVATQRAITEGVLYFYDNNKTGEHEREVVSFGNWMWCMFVTDESEGE